MRICDSSQFEDVTWHKGEITLIDLEGIKGKFINKGDLSEEEISIILGALEARNDRIMAIKSILQNIPKEYCTPKVKKDIELALQIISNK